MGADNKILHKKLNMTLNECIQKVKEMYRTGISQKEIANRLGVHRTTIENFFVRNNIKARKFYDRPASVKRCKLKEKHIEIINGLLLGDGCLSKTSNYSARLVFSGNNLHLIKDALSQLNFSFWSGTINCKPPGSAYYKQYKANRLKSHSYKELLDIYKKWYKNNKKIVPRDLNLTPLTCYWWFIGDGCCSNRVFICTDSFTRQENEFLIQQLKLLGCNSAIGDRNRIKFCKSISEFSLKGCKNFKYIKNKPIKYFDYQEEGIKFLKLIQQYMHSEYKYKFNWLQKSPSR